MPSLTEWKVPPANQPRAGDYAFDLDHVLASVVGLHSIIPNDAFSADNLGTERAGNGVVIDPVALVTEIEANSPAARGGVKVGDVILSWDNREVDHKSLPWLVAQTAPGKAIVVGVWRGKAPLPLTITTEKMRE